MKFAKGHIRVTSRFFLLVMKRTLSYQLTLLIGQLLNQFDKLPPSFPINSSIFISIVTRRSFEWSGLYEVK